MAPTELKAHELLNKSKGDLQSQLTELKQELLQLRVQKITGGNTAKLTKIAGVRRGIARVLTVINQKQRQNLREFYKKKQYLPLDLRPKKTRAIRRKLSKHEASRVTEKQKKRQIHFPKRAYAIKA
ncbi:MAG: 60S ribosomal protein L35 [Cyphobasidiales sp. Tagirdzhanova-0007]|nr:MAG: 60S ribosomal protein L35 [Cyphobasidiales sp. Tagirdzhanova-0007]